MGVLAAVVFVFYGCVAPDFDRPEKSRKASKNFFDWWPIDRHAIVRIQRQAKYEALNPNCARSERRFGS